MISGFLLIWRKQTKENKIVLLLFFILSLVWIFVSSARAGGDQWDNPRYRSLFLVWMAFLAGWSWVETQRRRSPWLWRLLLLEVVYIGFFIHWYLSRYYDLFKRMDFWPMVKLLGIYRGCRHFRRLIFDLIYNKLRRKPDQDKLTLKFLPDIILMNGRRGLFELNKNQIRASRGKHKINK